ncbi:MAG: hypothetical protein WCX83_00345 [Candidatus Cloacimonas sp.]
MIENVCALVKLKSLPDNSQDFIFGDPPYALGSTVYIDKDGKPKYRLAKDFMSKWEMPDHSYWEEFFKVAEQKLKFGGRILFFGIDRQLFLFQYYAVAAGFEIKQSLYWYFISNFPKATDLSKQIDKRLGVEQQTTGVIGKAGAGLNKVKGFGKNTSKSEEVNKEWSETESNTELGKKYEGYKYSISPLKQVLETVMVFQKRTKNKSVLDDVFAFENGDETISPSIWAIDEGRVPTSETRDKKEVKNKSVTAYGDGLNGYDAGSHEGGRYPSQMFIDSTCASKIDGQSGEEDASRILHHIGYLDEELDLVFYSPKVSTFEREHGCGDIEKKTHRLMREGNEEADINNEVLQRFISEPKGNNHPTLKPIKLIYQIAKLLKAPFSQRVFFPFAGARSEIIGFEQAGFNHELFSGSEISEEFNNIGAVRQVAWRELDINNLDENKKHIEKRSKEHKKQESLFDAN